MCLVGFQSNLPTWAWPQNPESLSAREWGRHHPLETSYSGQDFYLQYLQWASIRPHPLSTLLPPASPLLSAYKGLERVTGSREVCREVTYFTLSNSFQFFPFLFSHISQKNSPSFYRTPLISYPLEAWLLLLFPQNCSQSLPMNSRMQNPVVFLFLNFPDASATLTLPMMPSFLNLFFYILKHFLFSLFISWATSPYLHCFLFFSNCQCGHSVTFSFQHTQFLLGFTNSFHADNGIPNLQPRSLFWALNSYVWDISPWMSHWDIKLSMSKTILTFALPVKSDGPTMLPISFPNTNII